MDKPRILTPEEVRELLEEGRLARKEIEKRFEEMRRIPCTCCKGMCALHDKAR